jgi:hypothetical protein
MSETAILLAVALAVIALMAVLIYVASQRRDSTHLIEIRSALDQLLASGRCIEKTLAKQRSVLNDAHKAIHTAVTKGLQKPAA